MKLYRYRTLSILLLFVTVLDQSYGIEGVAARSKIPDVIGEIFLTETMYEDTLSDLARAYDQGYNEIKLANPTVDPWLPGEGTEIVIPDFLCFPMLRDRE